MFKALIILRITSLNLKNIVLIELRKLDFSVDFLTFFRGVYYSAKNLLKKFASVSISVTNLLSIKKGGIIEKFLSL